MFKTNVVFSMRREGTTPQTPHRSILVGNNQGLSDGCDAQRNGVSLSRHPILTHHETNVTSGMSGNRGNATRSGEMTTDSDTSNVHRLVILHGRERAREMVDKPMTKHTQVDDWYWAAPSDEPAGDRFIIENGQAALWPRVRREIDRNEQCHWAPIHRLNKGAQLEDILDMMFTVVPIYRVNLNRFVFEAAKIPVFAKFLRNARSELCNYVSNNCFPDHQVSKPKPYSNVTMRKLGGIVSRTLGCDEDWFI
jgi:hypothetical protein